MRSSNRCNKYKKTIGRTIACRNSSCDATSFYRRSQECFADVRRQIRPFYIALLAQKIWGFSCFQRNDIGTWIGVQEEGTILHRLTSDNAKEFLSLSFQGWLRENSTTHELSAPYSPESNGNAQRLNLTHVYIERPPHSHVHRKEPRDVLWAEAIATAYYLRAERLGQPTTVWKVHYMKLWQERAGSFTHLGFWKLSVFPPPKITRRA